MNFDIIPIHKHMTELSGGTVLMGNESSGVQVSGQMNWLMKGQAEVSTRCWGKRSSRCTARRLQGGRIGITLLRSRHTGISAEVTKKDICSSLSRDGIIHKSMTL